MKWLTATILLGVLSPLWAHEDVISDHPRASYDNVEDIDAMASALRLHLASQERYSFSRSWWQWDRLRHRFVDGGRKNLKELKILQAVFRALILDWHTKLTERGEGDRLYLFGTTSQTNHARRILETSDRQKPELRAAQPDYRMEILFLTHDSPLVDTTLAGSNLRQKHGINVLALQRGETRIAPPDGEEMLREGDVLYVFGRAEAIRALNTAED